MNTQMLFALCLALLWGVLWAVCLQATAWGRWLAVRRTWLTVVAGVGVDVAILWLVLAPAAWLATAGVFAVSSVGVIARSLLNEWRDER